MYHKAMERVDRLDSWLALVPAIVLVGFAAAHLWRSHDRSLSSWREGGMGMYADINDLKGREVRIYVQRERWESAQVGERYEARLNATRLEPTHEKLVALVTFLACDPRFLSQNPTTSHVRVDYLEQQFDPTTYTVRLEEKLKETHAVCR
jgi:hypothetical protein